MTSVEFTELLAYMAKEPHGWEMDNWRMGVVAAEVRNTRPHKKPATPRDFYPNRKQRSVLSPKQQQKLTELKKRPRK